MATASTNVKTNEGAATTGSKRTQRRRAYTRRRDPYAQQALERKWVSVEERERRHRQRSEQAARSEAHRRRRTEAATRQAIAQDVIEASNNPDQALHSGRVEITPGTGLRLRLSASPHAWIIKADGDYAQLKALLDQAGVQAEPRHWFWAMMGTPEPADDAKTSLSLSLDHDSAHALARAAIAQHKPAHAVGG